MHHFFVIITRIFSFFLVIGSVACKNHNERQHIGYDLLKPDEIIDLPDSLREISGITIIDTTTIACIQDENGIVFMYDILKKKIKNKLYFYKHGDYEGICKVDTSIFILRSDGALFEILNYESKTLSVIRYPTEMKAANNEGLCYDKISNRLLMARKNKIAKGKENKNKRGIYAFDLATKEFSEDPVINFNVDSVKKIVLKNNIKLPLGRKGIKAPSVVLHFASSEISIHPLTGKIFILSSTDHLLFIINRDGVIECVEHLNPLIFVQPEGLAFLNNGDMLISNEGHKQYPTLLRFNYKPGL